MSGATTRMQDFTPLYSDAGSVWNIDPQLLQAVAQVESDENPAALGPPTRYGRAAGLMQFVPETATRYGVADPHNPNQAVFGAAHYLADLLNENKGDVTAALQEYNGATADRSAAYTRKVLAKYQALPTPDKAQPAAARSPFDALMATPDQPAPAAPTTAPSGQQPSTPFERMMATPQPPTAPAPAPAAAAAAAPAPPTAPPTAAAGEPPPPIYQAPTTPLIRPPGTAPPDMTYGMNPAGPMPAPTGQPMAALSPGQANYLAGIGEGARRAIDVPAELLAGGVNWLQRQATGTNLPERMPASLPLIGGTPVSPAAVTAADRERAAAYQAQLGGDPNAQVGLRAGQLVAPAVLGGALGTGLRMLGPVGNFLGGGAGAETPGIIGWGLRRASGAVGGALQGGGATAMTGDPNLPIAERAAPGAVVGTALGGAVLPALSDITSWVANRFGSADTSAAQRIIRAMQQDEQTPAQIEAALAQLGQHGSLADIAGPNLRNLAEGVANSPTPGGAAARTFLQSRAEGQATRMDNAVRTATGATAGAADTMDQLVANRTANAAPLYESAFNRIVTTPDEAARVQRFIADPIGQDAMQRGLRVIQLEKLAANEPFNPADYGVTQGGDGTFTLNPGTTNLRLMDAVKRGYDGIVESFRNPTTGKLVLDQYGRAVNAARASYVGDLRDMFPRYGNALDAWAGPSQAMDAISMGRRVFTNDPDVTIRAVSSMPEHQQEMFRVGVANALQDKISATPDGADAARRLFGNDLIRRKIASAFGGEDTPAFQSFQNTMNQEITFAQTQRDLIQGSPTARRAAAIGAAQTQPPDLLTPSLHLLHGNLGAAVGNIGNQLIGASARGVSTPTAAQSQALGELMFGTTPEARNRLMQSISPGSAAALRNQLQNYLTGYPGLRLGVRAWTGQ